MPKYANTINSFRTESEKYTNEIRLENFGLLRRMYSNYLTTEVYERWGWSWSYIVQPSYQQSTFRIVVQFNNIPLPPGHLLAFKAVLCKKNSQTTQSSECICLKEHLWLTPNMNVLDICSMNDLNQFIQKDTLRIIIIVRHDWLVKKLQNDQNNLSTCPNEASSYTDFNNKFLQDMKSIVDQTETSDVVIRVHNRTYPCHRAVLSARSPYFHTLFHSSFREQSQNEIDLSAFLSDDNNDFDLLHAYLYKAECHLTVDNIVQYIQLADKFLLDELNDKCELFLLDRDHINERTVWNILDVYSTIGRSISSKIKERCFKMIKENKHLIDEHCHDLLKRHPELTVDLVRYFV